MTDVYYAVHEKRGAPPDAPRTMRVDYRIGLSEPLTCSRGRSPPVAGNGGRCATGLHVKGEYVSEWVCFEHDGYPRYKAECWWRQRSNEPVPETAEAAVELAEMGALAPTLAVTVQRTPGERFDRIVAYRLGAKPPRLDSEEGLPQDADVEIDGVPF